MPRDDRRGTDEDEEEEWSSATEAGIVTEAGPSTLPEAAYRKRQADSKSPSLVDDPLQPPATPSRRGTRRQDRQDSEEMTQRVSPPASISSSSRRSIGAKSSTPVRRRNARPAIPLSPRRSPRPRASASITKPISPESVYPDKGTSHQPARAGNPNLPLTIIRAIISLLTISISILRPFVSLLATFLAPFLMPILGTAAAITAGGLLAYFLLPHLPSFLLGILGRLLRSTLGNISLPGVPSLNIPDEALVRLAAIIPARTLATPACALTGLLCPLSFSSSRTSWTRPGVSNGEVGLEENQNTSEYSIAEPFWKWDWGLGRRGHGRVKDSVDVARVARGLSREVKQARDIFDSVQSMSTADVVRNLHYVKIWELGIVVGTGSNLEDKWVVSKDLKELGDTTRDLHDQVTTIDHTAVNSFYWLQNEFGRLVNLLESGTVSNATISTRLHALIVQLDDDFGKLYSLTSHATDSASFASLQGQHLLKSLHTIRHSLISEQGHNPIWKQTWEKSKHRLVGGIPPRSEMIEQDLALTRETIENVDDLWRHLEGIRVLTKGYRDQIGMSQASVVGFHLGAEGAGLDATEEVRVLQSLVSGLGEAVEGAKRRGGRSNREGAGTVRRIEA